MTKVCISGNKTAVVLTAFNSLSKTFDKQTAFNGDFAGLGDGNYDSRVKELGNRISAWYLMVGCVVILLRC